MAGQSELSLRQPGNSRVGKLRPRLTTLRSLSNRYSMQAALLLLLPCSRGGLLLHICLSILKVIYLQGIQLRFC